MFHANKSLLSERRWLILKEDYIVVEMQYNKVVGQITSSVSELAT